MARKELVVEARQVTGKKVAALRRAGILPGNIFGKGIESESIQLQTELLASTLKAAVANEVIDLKVGSGSARPVVIHKIQRNPLNGSFLHADFYQVQLREKMRADVPIVLIGESEAVSIYNGVLLETLNSVQVEALPLDLPASIEVDISVIKELEGSIHVGALHVPSTVTILTDPELMIVKVASPRVEEEEEAAEAEAGEERPEESAPEDSAEAPTAEAAAEAATEEASEEK
jgi:large subunit ribosomal protein L25